ncbi:aminoglycoside phosphotransferase family protein [Caulobacter sp. S45]|uniref:aminoglycoside phosphotransferase family protein n=1 Tax=Caulobacter sp. S45 TaxID=1641861 RepID=UPI00157767AB|nr:phosphotransferase [Caulobacter sp. S45]
MIFSDPRGTDAVPPDLTGRSELREAFLRTHGLADAVREPMPGDASTRAYVRLHPASRHTPLILMDAPPAAESEAAPSDATPSERIALGYNAVTRLAGGRVDAWAAVAAFLRARGLSAPAVLALDASQGFAVLEDLGSDLFRDRLEAGADPAEVYGQAVDLLVNLHAEAPPAILDVPGGGAWALPTYDALALRMGLDLWLQWWPPLARMAPPPPEALADWPDLWAPILARGERGATVFTHRDYHAENLLWLPDRIGVGRVGLLDFQDAVCGHPAWDLVSLLQDARQDVAPALEAAMLARYLAARPHMDAEAFRADYAALGALNALRILGPVFARQITAFGREKYRAFLPRMWRHLSRDLEHPDLAALKLWFDRYAPAEARA